MEPRTPLLATLALSALLAACPSGAGDPSDLPPEPTPALLDDDDATAPPDDDDATDLAPEHLLSVSETGELTRSPAGGPYTDIVGAVYITELLDGELVDDDPDADDPPPTCEVGFAAVGVRVDGAQACSFCDETWQVTFSLDEGDLGRCRGPDQPEDGEVRRLGFVAAEQALYWDYRDLGVWTWWYHASDAGDELTLDWQTSLGIELDD